jgi:site-specific recombinase XerD
MYDKLGIISLILTLIHIMVKSTNTDLPYFDDYLLHLQSNNYSEKTIYSYERDLQVFENFISENCIPFHKVSKQTIARFKAQLNSVDRRTPHKKISEKMLQSASTNRTLSALRSYLRYLIDMDIPSPIAPESVKLIKTEKKHPQIADLDELVRLVESPSYLENTLEISARNRAMLEVLFSTGMRISELLGLNRTQIDESGRIFIRGKGKKERFVYMTERAFKYLNDYLKHRSDNFPALFIPTRGKNTKKNEKLEKKRISANYLQERIKSYREKLKINIPISAHSLRHGFATYLAENGANPAAIQILLGHQSLETTTRYVNASDKYAEKSHRRYHPLKKLKE